jgi:hypothetical protein
MILTILCDAFPVVEDWYALHDTPPVDPVSTDRWHLTGTVQRIARSI